MSNDVYKLIEDVVLRKIARKHGLADWSWGSDHPLVKALMIEGAAIALAAMTEGSRASVEIHKSGAMAVSVGQYGDIEFNQDHATGPNEAFDWDNDPCVQVYERKLTQDDLQLHGML